MNKKELEKIDFSDLTPTTALFLLLALFPEETLKLSERLKKENEK